jgi:hypothetical protein
MVTFWLISTSVTDEHVQTQIYEPLLVQKEISKHVLVEPIINHETNMFINNDLIIVPINDV